MGPKSDSDHAASHRRPAFCSWCDSHELCGDRGCADRALHAQVADHAGVDVLPKERLASRLLRWLAGGCCVQPGVYCLPNGHIVVVPDNVQSDVEY